MSWTSPLAVAMRTLPATASLAAFGCHERLEVGDGLLHDAGALHHLREEHLAGSEQITDDVHAIHQGPLDDVQRTLGLPSCFLCVVDDELVESVHQRVDQSFFDGAFAPGQVGGCGLGR